MRDLHWLLLVRGEAGLISSCALLFVPTKLPPWYGLLLVSLLLLSSTSSSYVRGRALVGAGEVLAGSRRHLSLKSNSPLRVKNKQLRTHVHARANARAPTNKI